MSNHTPTPWRIEQGIYLCDPKSPYVDGATIASFGFGAMTLATAEANAAFALRAVNSLDDLIEALGLVVNRRCADFTLAEWKQIDAALAKARGDVEQSHEALTAGSSTVGTKSP